MSAKLKILIVEDNATDVDLLLRQLRKAGIDPIPHVVEARSAYEEALESFSPDIILSDYSLPAFDAVAAFELRQKSYPDIPFIIVSGVIGDENAVDLIKSGVTDYALKDRLFTLPQKIVRALEDKATQQERKDTAHKLTTQAAALTLANQDLVLQKNDKQQQAADLIILAEDLRSQKEELKISNTELQHSQALLTKQEEVLRNINEDLLKLNQHLEDRVKERTGELEKLNDELKLLSRAKDKILAVISHDLRNPLSALLLASEMLTRNTVHKQFESVIPFVEVIQRNSNNILNQLDDLVQWAKSQQEERILFPEKLQLAAIVNHSFELLKANGSLKNIRLQNDIAADIYVSAEVLVLGSILQNLITNSIKFSPPGAVVSVSAKSAAGMVEIMVTDTGQGMNAATRDGLFQNTSPSAAGTNNEKGSGLGLMLVKDFVSQLGGTLKVESELAKGTAVIFTIPEARPAST